MILPNGKWRTKTKLYIFKELNGGNFMTPILSLHNVDVTEFLAVLDTCEGNVYLVTSEGDRLNFAASFASLSVLQDLSKAARLQKQVLFAKTKMTSASFSDLICSATQVMPK